jgi:hypothetical protein
VRPQFWSARDLDIGTTIADRWSSADGDGDRQAFDLELRRKALIGPAANTARRAIPAAAAKFS